jgi:dihydrolipoamide dehydrogenase
MDVDFSRAIDRSREVADRMSNGVSFLFKKNKVQQVTGHGTVLSRFKSRSS